MVQLAEEEAPDAHAAGCVNAFGQQATCKSMNCTRMSPVTGLGPSPVTRRVALLALTLSCATGHAHGWPVNVSALKCRHQRMRFTMRPHTTRPQQLANDQGKAKVL